VIKSRTHSCETETIDIDDISRKQIPQKPYTTIATLTTSQALTSPHALIVSLTQPATAVLKALPLPQQPTQSI
jgi:hypothetical protein